MGKYKIIFKKSVAKDLRVLPKTDIKRILGRVNSLSENPRGEGCKKLSGKENYRIRQGLYRVIYEIKDNLLIVNVIKVAHRSSVYKSN